MSNQEVNDVFELRTDIKTEPTASVYVRENVRKPQLWKQFRALFLKNASLQKRRTWTNCCQICISLTMVVLIGVINILILKLLFDSNGKSGTIVYSTPSLIESKFYTPFTYFSFVDVDGINSSILGQLTESGFHSGMLGNIMQRPLSVNGKVINGSYVPFFYQYANVSDLDSAMLKTKQNIWNSYSSSKKSKTTPYIEQNLGYNTSVAMPLGAVLFNEVDPNNLVLNYVAMYEDQTFYEDLAFNGLYSVIDTISIVDNAFVQYVFSKDWAIEVSIGGLPYLSTPLSIDVTGFLAVFLLPFAFSFLLPVYVYNVVHERQERLLDMMMMNGLKMFTYWTVNYIYNLIIYLLMTGGAIIIAIGFQIPFFTQTSGWITFSVFLGWGVNQIAFAFFLSCFFSKERTATILCYLLVIASILAGIIVNESVFQMNTAPSAYFLWPPFAFYRAIYLTGTLCSTSTCPSVQQISTGSEYANIIAVLFGETPMFLVFTWYLNAVLPKEFGVRKSPFFPLLAVKDFIYRRANWNSQDSSLLQTHRQIKHEYSEDSDVVDERKLVEEMSMSDIMQYPVVIKNLNKVYNDKVAVVDLCIAVHNNECFGLLGPNGAGKTTTISMCTGLIMCTNGTAYIGGFDISTEIEYLHQLIGVTPQFDTLWDTLTAKETLLFYIRLRGNYPKDQEIPMATQYLVQVGLASSADVLVKELSGGMKRRLSVAVSLVGNPRVIFLDEPTTGLDPESRRQLWDLLLEVKKDRCIILTTHSMEEADIICNRIGIMSHGALKCIGPNVRLKNKFGEGYMLKISFEDQMEKKIIKLIKKKLPTAELSESFSGSMTFRIPSKDLVMSSLLKMMIKKKDKFSIYDWGITQSSIQDVFLNIIKNDET